MTFEEQYPTLVKKYGYDANKKGYIMTHNDIKEFFSDKQ